MHTRHALLLIAALAASPLALAAHDGGEGHACHRPGKMEKADANRDGSIDKSEARAMHDAHFDEMDRDKDGKLSADEVAACKEKHDHQHD